jgi:hypothetical protein
MGAHAPQISDGSDSLKKRNRFVPPSLDQVKEHFVTAGMKHSDAEEFFDHHAARGWKLSKGLPMVDWHRAAGTWKRNLGQFVTNNSKPKQRIPDRLPSPRIADRL